ncbi:MAG: polyprenyl synthetase family protein [Lentisphaeria bacterium]|nr:polyprenyl synthetase family protein [Lentisphaeria bacterium]
MSELKQTVPQDSAVREAIRRAAEDLVRSLGLKPPRDLTHLKRHAAELTASLELDGRGFGHYAMIVLNNALWTPYFPHIALEQRLLLLPFCLRKQPGCPADHDDLGLICKGCGQCDIPGLSAAADELDMPVLVAESSSAVADWVEQGVIQAVVGVSCLDSLEKSFPSMLRSAVPGIAVPLLRDGCRDTAFDPADLERAMSLPQADEVHAFPYGLIRETIDNLFTPDGVSVYIPDNMLREEAVRALTAHGKHYRPKITAGCYAALNPCRADLPEYLKPVALAVECFHKASLIHDDIEDGDAERYGEPACHVRLGLASALNLGDYLIGAGYKLFCHESVPPEMRAALASEAALAHCELALGQAKEFDALQKKDLQPEDCLEIHRLKTAPAFRVALFAGAIAAGRFEELHDLFHDFSDRLGAAYQLYDDLEDAADNPASAVDVLMCANGWDRETARAETVRLYREQRDGIYDLLETVGDVPLKIFLYRLAGKVLNDV